MKLRETIAALIMVMITLCVMTPPSAADDASQVPAGQQILELINTARANPLAAAEALGFGREQILNRFPDMAAELETGLQPLQWNPDLYQAAIRHTEDMLAYQYYSHESPDGSGFKERIGAQGYPSDTLDESLGMIAFSNFISAEYATRLVFENMLRDELQSESSEELKILSPAMEDAGVGIGNGTWEMGGRFFNIYLATCDFGRKTASDLELEMLGLVNQIRQNPLEYAQSLGMDPDQLLQALPELNEIFRYGLPPLSFHPKLYASAREHATDMLTNDFLSEISSDGRTLEDRVRETGIEPAISSEIFRLQVTTDTLDPAQGSRQHVERLFVRELSPDCVQRHILNPDVDQVGLVVAERAPGDDHSESQNPDQSYWYLLMVCDFALIQ